MISNTVRNELHRYLDRLTAEEQSRVVEFARALAAEAMTGVALEASDRNAGISVWDRESGDLRPFGKSETDEGFETIVAFFEPDNSFFDRFIQLLCELSEQGTFKLVSHLVTRAEAAAPSTRPIPVSNSRYLFVTYGFAPMARRYLGAGNRVVLLGAPNFGDKADVPCVHSDHARGGYEQAQHLLSLGHQRIAYVHTSENYRNHPRWLGFQSAIAQAADHDKRVQSLALENAEVASWKTAPESARAYFAIPGAPTGLVAWNDHEAIGLLEILTDAGIRVPDDVSLVGYDALPAGETTSPPLTTIDSGVRRQLEAAISLLTQEATVANDTQIVVPTNLIARGSTARLIG